MYVLEDYYNDINIKGLDETWNYILKNNIPLSSEDFNIYKLGERYEDGLARINKIEKKEMGKYYTPKDVASIMSQELLLLPGENICDVCCGVGNLIFTVLEQMGKDKAIEAIKTGKIYLYDIDNIAINICKYIIGVLYGFEFIDNINCIIGDFLSTNIQLPKNCKVISNPPYGKITTINKDWDVLDIVKKTKDYYSAIMAKIVKTSNYACIITPHSFMYGDKFLLLRQLLCQYGGHIYAFDNVPGNIFNGQKFGIFNTNNVNSVRAAISIINHDEKGYRVSPFIRFKSTERQQILNLKYLSSMLPTLRQSDPKCFYRIALNTDNFINSWLKYKPLTEYITAKPNEYKIVIPNTCRYFLCGVKYDLQRTGKMIIYAKDEISFYHLYIMLNSSFGYYWHRMCNGGITYPLTLLHELPIITGDFSSIKNFIDELISNEKNYLVIAKNAGAKQENIKFTDEQREKLNEYLCNTLNTKYDKNVFDNIHKNSCF